MFWLFLPLFSSLPDALIKSFMGRLCPSARILWRARYAPSFDDSLFNKCEEFPCGYRLIDHPWCMSDQRLTCHTNGRLVTYVSFQPLQAVDQVTGAHRTFQRVFRHCPVHLSIIQSNYSERLSTSCSPSIKQNILFTIIAIYSILILIINFVVGGACVVTILTTYHKLYIFENWKNAFPHETFNRVQHIQYTWGKGLCGHTFV